MIRLQRAAFLYKCLGHEVRLRILHALIYHQQRNVYVLDLAKMLNIPRTNVVKHLRFLRKNGIVTRHHDYYNGKAYYKITKEEETFSILIHSIDSWRENSPELLADSRAFAEGQYG